MRPNYPLVRLAALVAPLAGTGGGTLTGTRYSPRIGNTLSPEGFGARTL
jgi:hypothetical protein